MIVQKITTGFVIQNYDNSTGKCISQEFIAGEVEWEDNNSNPGTYIEPLDNEQYQPFDMVQP